MKKKKKNQKWFYQEYRTTDQKNKEQTKKCQEKPDVLSLIGPVEIHCRGVEELPKAIPKH